jgi:hypothetical protein
MAILDIFKRKDKSLNESNTVLGQMQLGNQVVYGTTNKQTTASQLLYVTTSSTTTAGRAVDMDNFQKLLNGTLPNQNLSHTILQYSNLDVHNHEIKKKLLGTVIAATRAGLAIGAYYSYGTTKSTTEQRDLSKLIIETAEADYARNNAIPL